MAGGDEVAVGMDGENPEAVRVATESVHGAALLDVPHADGPVLGVGDDVVLEIHDAADVVHVPPQLLDLKAPGIVHLPNADRPIVSP